MNGPIDGEEELLAELREAGRLDPVPQEALAAAKVGFVWRTIDAELDMADPLAPPPDAGLIASERQAAVWKALSTLPAHCQRLLRLFMADPPPTYEEVSQALGMPIGSIGPTRGRCLEHLRRRLGGGVAEAEAR